LEEVLKQVSLSTPFLFADPEGLPLFEVVQQVCARKPHEVIIMVGPEADLTSAEKTLLKEYKATFCGLTPTVLRAHQAVGLLAGVLRATL
jgi:16S rRNA U1498 N3-methylase RsmE